ncbi:DUF1003 domain-containing protein [Leptolyngbya sp. DQ-M1]|uniref:DUF1003 domain-containing protein n=1 Tax=Leptolyngbya sp. DQ-M1 TaxID=2933920 RepID=UPI003299EB70
MNSNQPTPPDTDTNRQSAVVINPRKVQPPEKKPLTLGQKIADKMAAKVGSWAFLIGQSTVLAGWITFNSVPGMPHWDEQPFILLNLVFSFASAYTAPVVLMSQNRQSEEDRENANHNYQVTVQAAQNLELLHQKLDAEYSKKLDELTMLIKQQQQAQSEAKVVFVPAEVKNEFDSSMNTALPLLNHLSKGTVYVNSDKKVDDIKVKINN